MCWWVRWPSRDERWTALLLHCALFQIHKHACHRGLRAVNIYHTLRLLGRSRCFPQQQHLTSRLHQTDGGQVAVKFTAVISWCNWFRIILSTVESGDRQVMKYAKQRLSWDAWDYLQRHEGPPCDPQGCTVNRFHREKMRRNPHMFSSSHWPRSTLLEDCMRFTLKEFKSKIQSKIIVKSTGFSYAFRLEIYKSYLDLDTRFFKQAHTIA